jgi:hypothetical protein
MRVMRPIMVYLAKCGIRNMMYVDDEKTKEATFGQTNLGRFLRTSSTHRRVHPRPYLKARSKKATVPGFLGKAVGSVHESLKYRKDTFEDDAHVRLITSI